MKTMKKSFSDVWNIIMFILITDGKEKKIVIDIFWILHKYPVILFSYNLIINIYPAILK